MKGKRMIATNRVNTFIKIISFDQNTKSLTLSVPQWKFVPYIVTQIKSYNLTLTRSNRLPVHRQLILRDKAF